MPERLVIADGSNLLILLMSLGEGNPNPRKHAVFRCKKGGTTALFRLPVAITGLDQADEYGEAWIFRGWGPKSQHYERPKVTGYYNSRSRTGHIDFGELVGIERPQEPVMTTP